MLKNFVRTNFERTNFERTNPLKYKHVEKFSKIMKRSLFLIPANDSGDSTEMISQSGITTQDN